ncbi:MAG: NAD-binding protein [Chloroflexi bacterium]|nr:NAD-binding protein [Chloroflexota bacterium]
MGQSLANQEVRLDERDTRMNVIIVGAGGLGAALARKLSAAGHRITVIENNPQAVSGLPRGRVDSGAMTVVLRNGATGAAMIEAGIADADVFIAATGKDSLNGLAAQRAKTVFRVDRVMTAVKDEAARSLYDSLGIITIDKTALASDQLAELMHKKDEQEAQEAQREQ